MQNPTASHGGLENVPAGSAWSFPGARLVRRPAMPDIVMSDCAKISNRQLSLR